MSIHAKTLIHNNNNNNNLSNSHQVHANNNNNHKRRESTSSISSANSLNALSSATTTASSVSSTSATGSTSQKSKKTSDSRLSLIQLSFVLGLPNNVKETAKREREILAILKDDLGFALGEKTWIRDTPSDERVRLIEQLYHLTEAKYGYGYTKEDLSVVVRRASYYLMQGRLRRERRMERKKSGLELSKKRSKKNLQDGVGSGVVISPDSN
ncbi:unnamed protein product [Ambrosiozyma monospora]|uniref:Unnamed protein product n=1 Tax=Ambrosiozyma monospora TaxID=43982 RepID=A0ACB5U750_AMBMO|nr:unnamed protein product [Ambrosiozyma monospora]